MSAVCILDFGRVDFHHKRDISFPLVKSFSSPIESMAFGAKHVNEMGGSVGIPVKVSFELPREMIVVADFDAAAGLAFKTGGIIVKGVWYVGEVDAIEDIGIIS